MNKEHFLTELKIQLRGLSPIDKETILKEYEDKFDALLADGLTEPYASKELGSPRDIAKDILLDHNINPAADFTNTNDWEELDANYNDAAYNEGNKPSFFIRFCQVAGIILFNALLMIWLILAGLALLFSGWILVITCLFAPILGLIALALTGGAAGLFQLFISIALCGLGFLGLMVAIPVTTYSLKFLYHYVAWTLNVLRGER
ncbi:DUF1700 domain-containing protein [Vagococcus coleopterorum]|uniref:DUF1700 domain-containing protein n=1 Tax=Vagococcus coleopterorum TaxID=2714946 RepID=A0A6G8ALV8_9ENTE|nr:DUF1700 domain-containing protein [Vagococcus coleopterorum]QIL46061.1 DUF1700 domain-containing protein [Vagococcus coleopterorum]